MTTDVRSTQELLPWIAPITDGVVVCKDSSFLASFEFFGADADSVGEAEVFQVGQAVDRMMNALRDLPITIWWTLRREKTEDYPGEPMPDAISQMLDDEHRAQFLGQAAYVNRHFLSVIWMPEKSASGMFGKVGALMADGASLPVAIKTAVQSTYFGKGSFAWKAAEIERALLEFESKLEQIEHIIAALGAKRLRTSELLGFLWAQANPGKRMTPKLWDGNTYFDAALSEAPITVHRDVLQFGDTSTDTRYMTVTSMKTWPSYLAFNAFGTLMSLPTEMVISHCFRVMNKDATIKHIESVRRLNDTLKYSLKSWIASVANKGSGLDDRNADPARIMAADEAREAMGVFNSGHAIFGYHTLAVTLIDEDLERVEESTRVLTRMFNSSPFTGTVRESMGALAAWATTLPGQWQECKRWLTLSSENATDLAPLMGVSRGQRMNDHFTAQLGKPCQALTVLPTDFNTPYYFNFHVGALGHALVIGPSRSGKSIGMNFLMSQYRKYGDHADILIFDKDASCRIPTLLQGGEHIDLRAGGEMIKLNPCLLATDEQHWGFLAKWVEGLIASRGYAVTTEDAKQIYLAVRSMGENQNPMTHRLFTIRTQLTPELGMHLDEWVGAGQYAHYFDNEEDGFSLSQFACIEMGEVMREPRVARAFMDYAFYRLQRKLEDQRTGNMRVTLVYVEECWFLLEDPYFAARLKDWLKTFAKLNAFLVLTTQSIEDLEGLPPAIFASVRDNIQTKIFLPNANALTEKLSEFYRKNFDLRPDLIHRIATAVPKQDYIIVQPEVSRKVRITLNQRQVAALRSDMAAQRVFARHYATKEPGWQAAYINELAPPKNKQE